MHGCTHTYIHTFIHAHIHTLTQVPYSYMRTYVPRVHGRQEVVRWTPCISPECRRLQLKNTQQHFIQSFIHSFVQHWLREDSLSDFRFLLKQSSSLIRRTLRSEEQLHPSMIQKKMHLRIPFWVDIVLYSQHEIRFQFAIGYNIVCGY